ncbi:hypothetical protein BGZ70_007089 [Mortierella alpina]|uniref:AMP-activated protein kinase glycogen-binding domain-containing protein n=1 Tax=Mortierella alpina TaxID=64518 RepID=A0A9P6J6W6_MORAP|nr:hypothetical protein BGZ70_007089 [Mortierella alpina]
MVTTQIQVLLFVGSRQLESILPYLPIPPSLSSALTFKSAHPPDTKTDSTLASSSSTSSVTIHRGNRIHKPAKERNRHPHHYAGDCNEGDPTSIELHDPQYPSSTTDDDDLYNLHRYNFNTMPRITPVLFTFPFPPQGQHFPSSVQVTGTFDDWQRTTAPLTKNDHERRFEAEIQVDLERLPQFNDDDGSALDKNASDSHASLQPKRKLVYKFVLDGHNWLTDPAQPNERDYEGNLNNVCFLKDRTLDETQAMERQEAETKVSEAEEDATIQKLGGGIWGTPHFAVNEPIPPRSDHTGIHQHSVSNSNSSSRVGGGRGEGGEGEMTHSATTKTLVDPPTMSAVTTTAGDAHPRQDGSVTPMASAGNGPHSPSLSTGDEHDGDGDYGVAILQGDPVMISPLQRTPSAEAAAAAEVAVGDAQPIVDASVAGGRGNAAPPLSINTATSNASASASAPSLVSSMSSHPTSSSNAQTPTSPTGQSKSATPKLYGVDAIKDNGAVKSAVPTTAISTTTPQFPSTSSLAKQSSKIGGKKSMWKRLKKVFS